MRGPVLYIAVAAVAASALTAGARPAAPNPAAKRVTALLNEALSAETTQRADELIVRAQSLIKSNARRLTKNTRGFLEADVEWTRGRVAAVAWQRDNTAADLRRRARMSLSNARDRYVRLVRECEMQLEAVEKRLGSRDPTKDPQWRKLDGFLARANYSEGWVLYNLGLVDPSVAAQARNFRTAIERFSRFTSGGYRNHPIVADCFLGEALCHYELKDYFRVLETLKPAQADNTPPDKFKRMTYLLIKAGQAYGDYVAAETAAERYFAALPADHKPDTIELGMALERTRCLAALADPEQNPDGHALFKGRLDKATKLLYAQGDPWRSEIARILARTSTVSPFSCLVKTRNLFRTKSYDKAAALADQGIRLARADTAPAVLADLRYAKLACRLNLRQYAQAHRAGADFLRHHPRDRRADDVADRALQAGLRALRSDPKLDRAELVKFFDFLAEQLPASAAAASLPWHRADLLIKQGRFAEARKLLAGVQKDAATYLFSQYGLALSAYKQAEKATDPKIRAARLAEAMAAAGRFVQAAPRSLTPQQQRAAEAVVDVAVAACQRQLRGDEPLPERVLALMARLDTLAGVRDRAADGRLALKVHASVLAGKTDQATALITDLMTRSRSAPAEVAGALIAVLAPLEAQAQRLARAGKTTQADGLVQQVIGIYEYLISSAQQGGEGVAGQESALRSRLAETLLGLGRHGQAIPHYQWLVKKTPTARAGRFIRGLAVCLEQSGRPNDAVGHWRVLAKGLKKDSDGWYEARYHHIRCLYNSGQREQGGKLLAYFRLQHPKVKVERWRVKFDQLARDMGLAPTTRPR